MVIRDYEVPCPGEGEDQDRRCEDVGLTGFPSKVLRWKGGEGGLLAGITDAIGRKVQIVTRTSLKLISFSLEFFRKRKVSSRLVISWWVAGL